MTTKSVWAHRVLYIVTGIFGVGIFPFALINSNWAFFCVGGAVVSSFFAHLVATDYEKALLEARKGPNQRWLEEKERGIQDGVNIRFYEGFGLLPDKKGICCVFLQVLRRILESNLDASVKESVFEVAKEVFILAEVRYPLLETVNIFEVTRTGNPRPYKEKVDQINEVISSAIGVIISIDTEHRLGGVLEVSSEELQALVLHQTAQLERLREQSETISASVRNELRAVHAEVNAV